MRGNRFCRAFTREEARARLCAVATALPWTRTSLHPLEFRAEHDGVTYILRAKWGGFEAAIHRDNRPVEVTMHNTYWIARGHCEAQI